MANEFKIKKGLIVNGSGSTILDIQGSQGQLFSVTDNLSGSLFSVNDISGLPILQVSSNDSVKLGTFNAEAIKVSGSNAIITGSLFGTSSWAVSASYVSPTTTNAFIQGGNSFGTTALLGTNDNQSLAIEASGSTKMFISSSGNVGIGTTGPGYPLSIENTSEFLLTYKRTGGTSKLWGFGADNSSTYFKNLTDSTIVYTITNGGNVGIGTSTPQTKLEVSGAITSNFSGTGSISFGYNSANLKPQGGITGIGNPSNTNVGNLSFSTNTHGAGTNYGLTEQMYIRTNGFDSKAATIVMLPFGGSVGIGTTTPNAKLDVSGSAIITGSLTVTNGITGSLFGTAATASYAPSYLPLTGGTITGDVTVLGTASIAFLNVQYESASVIYSSGSNVFGDATNDTQTLVGTVLVSGSQQITGSLDVSGGITGSLFGTASYVNISGLGGFVQGGNSFGTTALLGTNDNQSLAIETSGSERMRITSTGNVGIGTTSPLSRLQVRTNTDQNFRVSSGTTLEVNSINDADSAYTPVTFRASSFNFANGNVGIGTTSPGASLDILATSLNVLRLGRTGYDTYTFRSSIGTGLELFNTTDLRSEMFFDGAGNVGIGTTSPSTKLDLYSSSGGVSFKTYTATTNYTEHSYSKDAGFFIDSYQSVAGSPYTKTTDLVANGDSGAESQMRFFTSTTASSPLERMRITSAGNVGIGTTAPTGKLSIVAPGALATDIALRVRNSADTADLMTVNGLGNVGIGAGISGVAYNINFNVSLPGGGLRGGIVWSSGASILNRRKFSGANDNTLSFLVGTTTELLTIQERNSTVLTNNIGINNTNPDVSAILDIASTTKGFLPPRMTTTQRDAIATPATGLVVYDSTLLTLSHYNGSAWAPIGVSSFPYTGTAVITGSLIVTSTLQLDGTLTDYATVNSTIVGDNNLYTQATGSYTSAFVKYSLNNGANSRAGEFIANWNGTTVTYFDNSTTDIGTTSDIVFSTAIVSSQIQVNATAATSGWKIKTLATFI